MTSPAEFNDGQRFGIAVPPGAGFDGDVIHNEYEERHSWVQPRVRSTSPPPAS